MREGGAEFGLSTTEMSRRLEAYTRLVTFIALGAALSCADLLARGSLVAVLLLSVLFCLLLISRALLARSFARYAHTVWTLTELSLVRTCDAQRDEHPVGDIGRVSVKRTVSGGIRAVAVGMRSGGILYVNALQDPEGFVGSLRSMADVPFSEVREPLDFDAPWFYRVLGLFVGAAAAGAVRVAATPGSLNAKWIYLCVAAYLVLFGAFWVRFKPVTQSYGEGKRPLDVAVGVISLVSGLALGAFALAVF